MNDSLGSLRDIHLPDPVSIWPLAIGWWLLALAIVVGVAFYFYYYSLMRRRERMKKFALQKLTELEEAAQNGEALTEIISDTSILLRRVALAYFPDAKLAGKHGQSWLEFLNKSGQTKEFTQSTGRLLITAAYQKKIECDPKDLFALCRRWIKSIE